MMAGGGVAELASGFTATPVAAPVIVGGGLLTLQGITSTMRYFTLDAVSKPADRFNSESGGQDGEASKGKHKPTDYTKIKDPKNVNASTKPTPRQVLQMKEANRAQNGGVLKDDVTGEPMVDSAKSQKGITPPPNEAQVDHVIPVDAGGTRAQSNLQLRTRHNNRQKSNKTP
jgi:filamentous hemagglutinin